MTKIAILGARGRLGRMVAKAFLDAGYEVRAVTRDGKLPAELAGAEAIAADALDRQSLILATQGVDIVFNGLSPIYSDWSTCLPMAENVMAACHANRALHLIPGHGLQFRIANACGHHRGNSAAPHHRKGPHPGRTWKTCSAARPPPAGFAPFCSGPEISSAARARDRGSTWSWHQRSRKGVYTAPGPVDLVHEWTYLPDFAAAFVALAEKRDLLGAYENLNMPGHAVTDLEMKAAVEKAVGRTLRLASMPWWVLRAGSPFVPMWKAILSMSYLRFEEHRLASTRLEGVIGTVPHTPLDEAVGAGARRSRSRGCSAPASGVNSLQKTRTPGAQLLRAFF